LHGFDIGDVGHPRSVRRIDVELPSQGVVDHHRWPAAIGAGSAPIANLGLDPGQSGQARNAVGTTGFTLVYQVVMQLAVAIDLAALLPGVINHSGLANVFLGPFAQGALEPGIEAAGVDTQAPAHCAHGELLAMLGNKRVPHFASLAKYAVAFFRMSRSSVTRASSRFNCRISSA